MIEQTEMFRWLRNRILSDAIISNAIGDLNTGRVFAESIPEKAVTPAILIVRVGGKDIKGNGSARLFSNDLWQVKWVCEGDTFSPLTTLVGPANGSPTISLSDQLDNIVDFAVAGLGQQQWTDPVTGKILTVMCIIREDQVKYSRPERDSGVKYNHLGGIYNLQYYTE